MTGLAALILVVLPVHGAELAFPASAEHYPFYYVTAYYDHGGVDWACGGITYPGHSGSDYGVGSWDGMDAGRDIAAAMDGLVVETNDGEFDRCDTGECDGGGGYGNYVIIHHPDGKYTMHGHMKQWSVAVAVGQWVSCGTVLGQVGSSGHSTGPHIHFGVLDLSESYVDPFWGDCDNPPSYWVDQGSYYGMPVLACDDPTPACLPVNALACGEQVSGTNDGKGSTTEHAFYGCTAWNYTGAEMAWHFATDRDESVTLDLVGMEGDLDLYLLGSDACDAHDCLAASDETAGVDEHLVFDATAGEEYTLLVDGFEGTVSPFVLTVGCKGSPPVHDSGETAILDSSPTISDSAESDKRNGCACGISQGAKGLLWVLGAAALAIPRRRRLSA